MERAVHVVAPRVRRALKEISISVAAVGHFVVASIQGFAYFMIALILIPWVVVLVFGGRSGLPFWNPLASVWWVVGSSVRATPAASTTSRWRQD